MQAQLTKAQIKRARSLRAAGKPYAEIRDKLKTDVSVDTIRSHCLDIPVDGKIRTRTAKGPMTRNGSQVRPFSPAEDAQIRTYLRLPESDRPNLNQFANKLGRRRHSVANRINTLKKLDQREILDAE